jgi:raffinose/stachyose/melibiose transport system substrate-binding protein
MYNKDLFRQAGVTGVPKTWNEMPDACAKLKALGVAGITVDDAYMACLFGYTIDRLAGMDAALSMESIGIPMGNSSQWPAALAEAKTVVDAATKRLPWAAGMEDNPDANAKIKENFARLVTGGLNAGQFAASMAR